MVVIAVDQARLVDRSPYQLRDHAGRRRHDPRPVRPGPGPGPADIGEVGLPRGGRYLEGRGAFGAMGNRAGEVPSGDQLPHAARARMDHDPQHPLVVGLELEEMVSPAERAELPAPLARRSARELAIRKVFRGKCPFEPLRHRAGRGLEGRDGPGEPVEEEGGDAGIVRESLSRHIEAHRHHPATDVATDGGGVDESPRRQRHADTHLPCPVNIGHDRHPADIRGSAEPVEGSNDIGRERAGQPAMDRHPFDALDSLAQRGASFPSSGAVARYSKRSEGARFRVMAWATSPRSQGVRAWRCARTSVGAGGTSPGAEPTMTRSWEASGAGTTRTTWRSRRQSSPQSPRARLSVSAT